MLSKADAAATVSQLDTRVDEAEGASSSQDPTLATDSVAGRAPEYFEEGRVGELLGW